MFTFGLPQSSTTTEHQIVDKWIDNLIFRHENGNNATNQIVSRPTFSFGPTNLSRPTFSVEPTDLSRPNFSFGTWNLLKLNMHSHIYPDANLFNHINRINCINFVKNGHLIKDIDEPLDVILNGLYKSFNLKSCIHNQFKILCDSIKIDTPINNKIKDIILKSIGNLAIANKVVKISYMYEIIKYEIYKNCLTDFLLISADDNSKTFPCLKAIIQTIPYFDMLIKDCQQNDNSVIIDDFDLTVYLIKILCNITHNFPTNANTFSYNYVDIFDSNNYVEMFELMDKYLMKDHFYIMINYGYEYIKNIAQQLVDQNKFDKIQLLYRILNNIINDETFKNTNIDIDIEIRNNQGGLGIYYMNKDIVLAAKEIIKKIFQLDLGEHIFDFDDWQNLFKDEYKLRTIHRLGNYELLNIMNIKPELVIGYLAMLNFSNIKPELVIEYLAMLNFSNNNYTDIFDTMNMHNSRLIFGSNNIKTLQNVIIIDSYYPILKYTKITRLPVKILNNTGNYVTIEFLMNNLVINIEDNIIFGDNILNDKYKVKSIVKCVRGEKTGVNVSVAKSISPFIKINIVYKLFFDWSCSKEVDISNDVWLCEYYLV